MAKNWKNFTEEDFDKLEESEHQLGLDELSIMLIFLRDSKEDILAEIIKFYKKYGTNDIVTYNDARKYVSTKDRRRRIAVLLDSIEELLENAVDASEIRFRNLVKELIKTEQDTFDIKSTKEHETEIQWGQDDKHWYERLWDDKELWFLYLTNDLKQGFIRQRKLDDVLKQVNKRFDYMENVLERLVGTETNAICSVMRQEIFKKLGIEKYQYYTQADEITCETCGPMNGLIFPISAYEIGVTAPPIHPNCRCYTVPLMD